MAQMPESVKKFTTYMRVTKNRSQKTVSEYEHDLLTFFRYYVATRDGVAYDGDEFAELDISRINNDDLRSITAETILNYLGYVATDRNNEAATRARKLSSLKSFFKYLQLTLHIVDENPAINIDTPAQKKRLPQASYARRKRGASRRGQFRRRIEAPRTRLLYNHPLSQLRNASFGAYRNFAFRPRS